ncbi:MAG: putative ABC exporter domain-containing protein [Vulcanimicrobiaceae bacterium]
MSDLAPLAYLETRRLANFFRRTMREPARIAIWAIALVWIVAMSILRVLHSSSSDWGTLRDPAASLLGFGSLAALGVVVSVGAGGQAGAFSGAADARFLTSSQLSERSVVLWLQLRNSAITIGRIAIAIVVYAFLFTRAHTGSAFLAMIGLSVLGTMLSLPAFELGQRIGQLPVQILGGTLAGLSSVAALVIGGANFFSALTPAASALERLGVGRFAAMIWNGYTPALLLLFYIIVLVLALSVVFAEDLYPELYAASMSWQRQLKRNRGWSSMYRPASGVKQARSHSTNFSGPWIAFWKQGLTLLRSPAMRIYFGIELIVAVGGGLAAGAVGRSDPSTLLAIVVGVVSIVIVLLAVTGTSLANDISKPLWWIGTGTTFYKLAAWTCATSVETAFVLTLGSIALATVYGSFGLAITCVIVSLMLPPLVRSVGVVTYSFFPAAIDQRGPAAAVRVIAIYLCLAPPTVVGILAAAFLRDGLIAAALALLTLLAKGILCIWIAANRIEGRGAEYAIAETI